MNLLVSNSHVLQHRLQIKTMLRLPFIFLNIFAPLLSVASSRPSTCTRPDTTEIIYRGGGDHDLPRIYDELVSCPNITTLELDLVWGGCVPPNDPWAFDFKPGDRFPALRKLSLSNYDLEDSWRQSSFYQSRWSFKEKLVYAWKHVPQFLTNVYHGEYDQPVWPHMPPPNETNLDKWLRAMDFSKIEELHLAQEQKVFYERMQGNLPALRKASFIWRNSGSPMPEERVKFIQRMPPVESLSIAIGPPYYYAQGTNNRTQFPISTMLETHGQSLQSLTLRQAEGRVPRLRRPMLSLDDIHNVQASSPDLKYLQLDIDRDASYGWPNKTLDALMGLESLESLSLRLELGADLHNELGGYVGYERNPIGISGPGPFREPEMSLNVAERLSADLRAKKQGAELKRIEFIVGDIAEKPYSGPLYIESWEDDRARSFVCETTADREHICSIQEDPDPWD